MLVTNFQPEAVVGNAWGVPALSESAISLRVATTVSIATAAIHERNTEACTFATTARAATTTTIHRCDAVPTFVTVWPFIRLRTILVNSAYMTRCGVRALVCLLELEHSPQRLDVGDGAAFEIVLR